MEGNNSEGDNGQQDIQNFTNDIIKPRVSCFDADFVPFYVCHNKKDQPKKSLNDCLHYCDNLINSINRYIKSDYYCGFLTVDKCFRYKINPDYKANRKYDNLPDYIKEVRQHMIDKHSFIGIEGYEADDLVVSYKKQHPEQDVIIVSPDKDILMSVNVAFNPKKLEFITNSGHDIQCNFWEQMVKGDGIDGIHGIPGKGKVYFKKITDKYINSDNYDRDKWYTLILLEYVEHFGEYEGIKEFTKNYLSLKMVDNVKFENEVKLNETKKLDKLL